jgi:hypothetical protein
VNEQGVNDPQVDQDENDRPKRLNRDKQDIGEGWMLTKMMPSQRAQAAQT